MRRLPLVIVAATAGLLALGSASASAAVPRVVPEGDTLYAIACPYYTADDAQLPVMQLIELDSATAVGTLVGTGTASLTDTDCAGQGAWDATTSTAYAIAFDFEGDAPARLVVIDPATGVSTLVGTFSDGTDDIEVASIAINPQGVAYAAGEGSLYRLDLATAGLTVIGSFNDSNAMSFDPTSGVLYSVRSDGLVVTVNPTDATSTVFGQLAESDIYSFAIDSAGIFWFGVDDFLGDRDYEAELFSVDPSEIATSQLSSGAISVGDTRPYPEALLLVPPRVEPAPVPAPALADTGLAGDASIALAAAALALVGLGVVATRRRRTA